MTINEFPIGTVRVSKRTLAAPFYLPANPRIALIGTSSSDNAVSAGAILQQANAIGGLNQLRLRRRIFRHFNRRDAGDARGHSGDNFGISGADIEMTDDYLAQILSAGVYDALVMQYAQNDVPLGTVSAAISKIRDRIALAHAAGIHCFLVTLNPRSPVGNGGIPLTNSAAYRKIIDFNLALEALAHSTGCQLIDTRPYLNDAAIALSPAGAGISSDGLHMTPLGHARWSLAAEEAFQRTMPHDVGDDIVQNPTAPGNYFSAGTMTGTGGVHATGTLQNGQIGSSGPLPDKVRFGLSSASTSNTSAVTSIVDDPDVGRALRVNYALVDADLTSLFTMTFTDTPEAASSSINTGNMASKWVRGYVKVFIEEGGENISQLSLLTTARNSSNTALFEGEEFASTGAQGPVFGTTANGRTLWLVTDPMLCPTGTQRIALAVRTRLSGNGSTIVHYSAPALREVPAP